jgi:hypothetical protein
MLDTRATLIDEIIDLHDLLMTSLFSKAKRKHSDRFQQPGKTINDMVQMAIVERLARHPLSAMTLSLINFVIICYLKTISYALPM